MEPKSSSSKLQKLAIDPLQSNAYVHNLQL
jgi:hypothetical protein